jgi:hypothetical protein
MILYKTQNINIWMAAGSNEAVLTILLVWLLFTIGLLTGYYSRVCSLALFVFMNSWNLQLETKNGGGLEVLTVFLLWGVWLPLGDSYSLDALSSNNAPNTNGLSSDDICVDVVEGATEALVALRDRFVSVAIPLHMAVMYYCCGVVKETEHWNSGMAVELVVNCGMATNQPLASIMASLPMLCRLLTYKTYYVETYGGFALLVPSTKMRMLALGLLIPFHLGMHLALDIATFQPTMMSALILLTPTEACDVLEQRVQAVLRKLAVLCAVSRKQCAGILLRTGRRAKAMGGYMGAAFVAVMVLVLITLTVNDMCRHLDRITEGKHTCWPGTVKRYPAFIRRWAPILGMPQNHSPFQYVNNWEDYFHIVGLVEDRGALVEDGVCENGEKAVAIFTDKTASQLNFDNSVPWSPDQQPHANQRWKKFFENPFSMEKSAHVHLADHLCRKWNSRPGQPKLKSLATVRIWKRMTAENGSLVKSSHKYSVVSHFQCSDHGQSGRASNASLIHDKMKEVLGASHMRIFLENNAQHPLRVYWVEPETGQEIAKGRVRAQDNWIQDAEPGHVFKFYWDRPDMPEGSHAEKGLLAQVIKVGQTESNVVVQPKEWKIWVRNHGQYPLQVYWVHHKTGKEFAKGHIGESGAWDQTAELGHVSLHAMISVVAPIFAHFYCNVIRFRSSGSIGIFQMGPRFLHRKSRLTRELKSLLYKMNRSVRIRPRMPQISLSTTTQCRLLVVNWAVVHPKTGRDKPTNHMSQRGVTSGCD